jgi:hypothetical protein
VAEYVHMERECLMISFIFLRVDSFLGLLGPASSLCIAGFLADFLAESMHAWTVLTVKFRQPSHEFTFGVGMTFVSYPLVLTPVV